VASNDPTDTGGLFVGRRPGTRPVRFREVPVDAARKRREGDRLLAYGLLALELILCISIWGPQPALALWFGSQVQYWTGSVSLAIVASFAVMLVTLFATLMIARRVDHAWKLVRRAAGIRQERGALERIFVAALVVVGGSFMLWFIFIHGPGSSIVPLQAPK
jgi:hypothetical protein